MPRSSCPTCGAARTAGAACPVCGSGRRSPARGYRGLAGYREMRARVLALSDVCHLCGDPGADEIDHVIPYAAQDPATRDDPSTWRVEDFRPVHGRLTAPQYRCNQRRGARPIGQIR
jgi:ribosomal protein L32